MLNVKKYLQIVQILNLKKMYNIHIYVFVCII